ncbi:hypothetical protein ACFWOJ_20675 [Streptomyces sp. NPDC058439]|uniref:hypothetical protein n=1 Tax=Streptomyces sp. NPDC058439 TaxID=3346500 RepID=UPI003665EA5E
MAADDLDAGVAGEPAGQRVGGPFGKQAHWPAFFHVDQHGAVVVAFLEREVVDTQDPHRADFGVVQCPDEPQHRVLAESDRLELGEAGAGPAADGQCDDLPDGT